MARIRSIKPELLEDERTARLSHVEWRLFVSLLLLADDYGNLRAAPDRILGAALWAHPREDVAKILDGIVAAGLVVIYAAGSQTYAHISGWDKHQKVDHPGKPLCPALSEGSRLSREEFAKMFEGLAPDQDQDQDHDLGSGPLPHSSSGSPQSPDQIARSNENANRATGFGLQKLFARVRAGIVEGALDWQTPPARDGRAAEMADLINADPTALADVEPTMELFLRTANEGKRGPQSKLMAEKPAFGFAAWCTDWTPLREDLRRAERAAAKPKAQPLPTYVFTPRPKFIPPAEQPPKEKADGVVAG
jgi:hypothetical protein